MLADAPPEQPDSEPEGRLSQAMRRLFMKRAIVAATERLADRFRLITLEGPALEGVTWTPGQKVQIAMGSAFATRTYTPIEWNASTGRTCILGYAHGEGPGSAWVRGVAPGDECDVFGPRSSLDARRMSGPLAIFGDETSIGLAHALVHQDPTRSVACHFEIGDREPARLVMTQLGLDQAAISARREDDAHLAELEAALPALAAAGASFVMTGRAAMIQRLRTALKHHAVPAARIATKAYWAPGKTGLD